LKKLVSTWFAAAGFCLVLGFSTRILAQDVAVVHWINEAGENAQSVLNTNGVFTTDFKGVDDLTVTPLASDSVTTNIDVFGGTSPGNNPVYLTGFLGVSSNGTGDGVAGDIEDLDMTSTASGALQFDFSDPLTPQDRILLADLDGVEQYLLQAYSFNGSSYVQETSLSGWTAQDFSGTTGITPNSTWPVWDPTSGTATSGAGGANLNEELFVLTPDEDISRLVVSKQSTGASGQTTAITFLSLNATPATPIITWANPAAIPIGAPLSSNQLNATANVPGTFAYSPTNGAVPPAGTNTLSVVFTPTDTIDYASVTDSISLVLTPFASVAQCLAVHWIKDAGQNAATVLNTNGVFITDFKGIDDLTVTRLTSDPVALYVEMFGGTTPGNNPGYLTTFVGLTNNGTGDGTYGDIEDLNMTADATGALQFDFLYPLAPEDRILLVDVDGPEEYLLQAYVLNDSSYVQETNLAGWTAQDFSGTTGITPNSTWPVWNPTLGTVTSGTSQNLDQELFVLAPDQNISRLVVSKQNSGALNWNSDITFLSLTSLILTIQRAGANVVLTWTNSVFALQAAPTVTGTFTNVPGATSPYTNAITGSQEFFRLEAP
jgi:hypothetical protein